MFNGLVMGESRFRKAVYMQVRGCHCASQCLNDVFSIIILTLWCISSKHHITCMLFSFCL